MTARRRTERRLTARRLATRLAALAFALALVLAWEGLAQTRLISPIFFPAPSRALAVLVARVADGSLWVPLAATILRMVFGWLLACVVGIALGAAIASSRLARDLLEPTLEFLRPLPASAMIPVAILFLGLSNAMALAVIAFGAIWPVLLASVHGFSSVPSELRDVAGVLGFGRRKYLQVIAFPAAAPDIVSGLRVSLAIALILAVVTEMQASLAGLGWDIFYAQRVYRSADLYAGLIVLGLVGLAANHLLERLERRALPWRNVGL
jgi:ABC-type nitrate/sulfonate/bicarbonate transport system permease component